MKKIFLWTKDGINPKPGPNFEFVHCIKVYKKKVTNSDDERTLAGLLSGRVPENFQLFTAWPKWKNYSTGTKGGIELKQIRVQKNVDQIFFGTTKCWVHAILGPKQFGGQKNFGPTQILGPAIFLGQKQISGLKQIFGLKKFWVWKKVGSEKNVGS